MKKRKSAFNLFLMSGVLALGLGLGGCGAMNTAIKKRDLEVQTQMSETIFLEPLAPAKKVVYFDIRNTSDKEVNVKEKIASAFINRGYRITDNPEEASYMLQGNILKVDKSDLRESRHYLSSGYGSGIAGAVAGAVVGYAATGSTRTGAAMGLAGGALGFVGDALVEDTLYVMVTDLQIRERPLEGEVVTQTQKANLAQGSSTVTKQNIKGAKIEWKTYKTRIVSTANKMNLEFEEAQPVLETALAKSISGVF